MIDDFVRDLDHLQKAESLIGRIWFKFQTRRFGLFVFGGLIAVFGLGMTNVAGFYALQESLGHSWAAGVIAIADFVLAAMIILAAGTSEPGPEIDLAYDARKMAIEAIHADARDLKSTFDTFGQEIRDVKDAVTGFVQDPMDAALQTLLVPAATSIIKGLRTKKDET